MRGSCERARTGGAALSTTAARTRGAALAPSAAGRAMNAVWQRPVCQCRLGLRGCRSALPGWSRALRPRSQPARFLPSGGDRQRGPRRGGLAGCSALGRRVVPMCNESAIDARPAQRSRGTGSRFGAGMGVRRRAGASGGAHPVNWSPHGQRLELAGCSRPGSARIRAPLGHGPVGTMPHRSLGGREAIRARGRPPCPRGRWGCVFRETGSDGARRGRTSIDSIPSSVHEHLARLQCSSPRAR